MTSDAHRRLDAMIQRADLAIERSEEVLERCDFEPASERARGLNSFVRASQL